MNKLIKQLMDLLIGTRPVVVITPRILKELTDRDLIKLESVVGRTLFGQPEPGHAREFFCLDAHTWIWYEQWDEDGEEKSRTIRYESHPQGILKVEDSGKSYSFVKGQELENLAQATQTYCDRVTQEVYQQDAASLVASLS